MPRYYNSKEKYGNPGPIKAPSKEALADCLTGLMESWAEDEWVKDNILVQPPSEWISRKVREMKEDFILGLEEIVEMDFSAERFGNVKKKKRKTSFETKGSSGKREQQQKEKKNNK